jgi:beta-mannosidase
VALYRDSTRVDEAEQPLELPPRATIRLGVEAILGRFVDASYAYRFGEPPHDAVVVSLERGGELLSQAVRFPAGRPPREPDLGLEAERRDGHVVVRTRKLAHGVRIHGLGARLDGFVVEPGGERVVAVRREGEGRLTAVNLDGEVAIR